MRVNVRATTGLGLYKRVPCRRVRSNDHEQPAYLHSVQHSQVYQSYYLGPPAIYILLYVVLIVVCGREANVVCE